jgi:hypothetical protein
MHMHTSIWWLIKLGIGETMEQVLNHGISAGKPSKYKYRVPYFTIYTRPKAINSAAGFPHFDDRTPLSIDAYIPCCYNRIHYIDSFYVVRYSCDVTDAILIPLPHNE